ncbi:MAG TPA: CehA/McbA family metallohydrolase [Cytophagaceae bacterium]|jgi:hypothetical protein
MTENNWTTHFLIIIFLCASLCSCTKSNDQGFGILEGTILDSASASPISARVYIIGDKDSVFFAEKGISFYIPWMQDRVGHSGRHFNTIGNTFRAKLPTGTYRIVIEKGKEYRRFSKLITVETNATQKLNIQLNRWINMNQRGWYSADHHVHRNISDIPTLLLSEDLNFAFFQGNWNERKDFLAQTDSILPKTNSAGTLQIDPSHFLHVASHEIESEYGALLYHLINKKDFPLKDLSEHSLANYFALSNKAKEGKGFVELDKPIYRFSHLAVLLNNVDFIELANNHNFDRNYLPEGSINLNRSLMGNYSDDQKGYTHFVMDLYYNFLNIGKRIIPTAGSASYPLSNPFGYNRTYVQMKGEINTLNYFNALKSGRSFISNGPMIMLSSGNNLMGDTVKTSESSLPIRCAIHYTYPLEDVEIIFNGEVIKQFKDVKLEGDSTIFNIDIPITKSGWIAARCFHKIDQKSIRFGHTSPIFVQYKNQPFIPVKKSIDFLKLINQSLTLETLYGNKEDKLDVLSKCAEAATILSNMKSE